MKVKRTFAPDIRQAMRRVREEQGADAVILGNRRVDGGIEIISAVDYDEDVFYQAIENSSEQSSPRSTQPYAEVAASVEASEKPTHEHVLMRSTRAPRKPVRRPPAQRKPATTKRVASARATHGEQPESGNVVKPLQQATPSREIEPLENLADTQIASLRERRPAADTPAARPAARTEINHLRDELRALRGLMENQLHVLEWDRLSRRHPNRVTVLSRLNEMDIGTELSRKLVAELQDDRDLERSWRNVLANLARQVPISDDDFMQRGGVIALVGATGVGKTTTVAKLAARFTMQHGQRDVALVTTDTYRIGAKEQLLHFAQIIGIPLYAANDQQELERILAKLCDKKLVLIDTAGMSQRDIRLTEQFVTLREVSPLLRSYLVISANTQLAALDEVVRTFGGAELAGCIVTKLDEATSLGSAITVSIRHRLPIAYVGTGQRVPEDLSPARAHRLIGRAVPLARRYGEREDDDTLAVKFAGMGGHADR
ncbi:MAG: flagellar biosynthesis protein FlhF [Gammaproteobacteria bacterium]|nr:flagellar biosynthesis protein FlhF [Gammaproteobacteria bacterium]